MRYTFQEYVQKLLSATGETLYMVFVSTVIAAIFGTAIGIVVAVTEYQFDRLVELDTEMYNSDRVEKAHRATYVKADGKSYYKKIDMENDDGTLLDEKQRGMLEDITEQATADKRLSVLSKEDREIYELYYLEEYTQVEIAEEIGKTQSYVAKHLAKIEDALSGSSESDEAKANAQWEKFLDKFRTDDDEDILWDMFRVIMPVDDQAEMVSWFYSYREYYKFGLSYLVIRPFSKYRDDTIAELEFGNRLNELPHRSREVYYDIFDGQIDELRWLYLALCEEVEYRKKTLKEKPKQTNFEKIFEEAEKACSRLDMTQKNLYIRDSYRNNTHGWKRDMLTSAGNIRM